MTSYLRRTAHDYDAMMPEEPIADTKPQTERILRRTDIYLLPFLALLFLLNSLDRSNIGNAETAGFTRHAGLAEEDLNDAVSAFFVAFVALQPVGAALGKRVGARRWVSGVMTGWGFLTCCMATVKTRAGLLALRTAIGALEGLCFLLSPASYSRNRC
jgi:MFS family permease